MDRLIQAAVGGTFFCLSVILSATLPINEVSPESAFNAGMFAGVFAGMGGFLIGAAFPVKRDKSEQTLAD